MDIDSLLEELQNDPEIKQLMDELDKYEENEEKEEHKNHKCKRKHKEVEEEEEEKNEKEKHKKHIEEDEKTENIKTKTHIDKEIEKMLNSKKWRTALKELIAEYLIEQLKKEKEPGLKNIGESLTPEDLVDVIKLDRHLKKETALKNLDKLTETQYKNLLKYIEDIGLDVAIADNKINKKEVYEIWEKILKKRGLKQPEKAIKIDISKKAKTRLKFNIHNIIKWAIAPHKKDIIDID